MMKRLYTGKTIDPNVHFATNEITKSPEWLRYHWAGGNSPSFGSRLVGKLSPEILHRRKWSGELFPGELEKNPDPRVRFIGSVI